MDDSTSMRVNNVNHIVDKSIAIVCQTLSSLEVGKLGVVKFGKESEIVQHLQVFISNITGCGVSSLVYKIRFDWNPKKFSFLKSSNRKSIPEFFCLAILFASCNGFF